jgi:hypothetical protein
MDSLSMPRSPRDPVEPSPEFVANSVPEILLGDADLDGGWGQLQFEYICTPYLVNTPHEAVFRVTNAGSVMVFFDENRKGFIDLTLSQATPWHKVVKVTLNKTKLLPGDSTVLWAPIPRRLKEMPFELSIKYRALGESGIERFGTGSMGVLRDHESCTAQDLRVLGQ